ncbi:nickel pincer cofactor biosynthesis protein LarC [Methanosarcina sp. MSH10X1]|uniref:nickel pincer cofactor biosynthesis protein LarC n=1 Tax=Methanosarcina sp. MSH10X1 TaxID=2507075 RepID=UPI000FFC5A0F|nr:nickel pincer cofactor biosynthesis protein LarC [Methanosarcina sp. MSH10X1]RXA21374.1 nickel pincer cofactor biosynthesis protein LarC [Methanosarcina sp. MSH10X1]
MKALIFNPFSGAAGDMILGCTLDLGADRKTVKELVEASVDVSMDIREVVKKGIKALDVRINVPEKEPVRTYPELVDVVKAAGLPPRVEASALDIFLKLAEAEASVHGQPDLEKLHFHEVGQSDALADIIGSSAAIHSLNCDSIYCTPINVGSGTIMCAHGVLPVPAPATLEILRRGKFYFMGGTEQKELLTPTGAAILAHFARPVETFPQGRVTSIGYGAGDSELAGPNVLQGVLSELDSCLIPDIIEVLETNADDVSGEVLGNLFEELLAMGARDVAILPATMKKGRPAHVIKVIAKPEDTAKLARKIIIETGSLGIRVIPTRHRLMAARRIESVRFEVEGQVYEAAVKIARDSEGILLNISAEFEDCKKIAKASGVPVKEVMRRAEEAARKLFS